MFFFFEIFMLMKLLCLVCSKAGSQGALERKASNLVQMKGQLIHQQQQQQQQNKSSCCSTWQLSYLPATTVNMASAKYVPLCSLSFINTLGCKLYRKRFQIFLCGFFGVAIYVEVESENSAILTVLWLTRHPECYAKWTRYRSVLTAKSGRWWIYICKSMYRYRCWFSFFPLYDMKWLTQGSLVGLKSEDNDITW